MMILVTYDVETITSEGNRRLRKVAKICKDYGQRVQNSVFECIVSPSDYIHLKKRLEREIDKERDSLRFYKLGKNWQVNVEFMGKITSFDPEKDSFIL